MRLAAFEKKQLGIERIELQYDILNIEQPPPKHLKSLYSTYFAIGQGYPSREMKALRCRVGIVSCIQSPHMVLPIRENGSLIFAWSKIVSLL
jgi:hypothetical protein